MEEPKKRKTIHIGYVIALIVPILVVILLVVLWPSGEGGVTPTPTSGPTATATPHGTVTPTATTPPVGSVTVSIDSPDTVKKSSGRDFHVTKSGAWATGTCLQGHLLVRRASEGRYRYFP